jgi:DNA-binding ferritin-like protein
MKELAILLRSMQLYTQNAHNLVDKGLFFQDHDFLGGLYETYDTEYDSIVERMIGLTDSSVVNLMEIQVAAINLIRSLPTKETDNIAYFMKIEDMEIKLRIQVAKINQSVSIGTQQLIGDIANASEGRSYKLKQRIKSNGK